MPTVVDLFCGAGGLSLGFKRAGFTPVFAVDADHWSIKTYRKNLGEHAVLASIEHVKARRLDDRVVWTTPEGVFETPLVDALVGGPPCQGFSRLNRRAGDDDPRNVLWKQYYRILKSVSPKIFLMENVPQLLQSHEATKLMRNAKARGYRIAREILQAESFGVPQRRRRAFVLGVLGGDASFPVGDRPIVTVREAFEGLSLEPSGYNLHIGRNPTAVSLKRYAAVPPGGNRFNLPKHLQPPCWMRKKTGSTDVFGRMHYDRPAPTIRTEFFKPEKGRYLHPIADRAVTLREGARLQTFPDDFEFEGAYSQIARQIGNAVPVALASAVAQHIYSAYFGAPEL